MAVRRRRVDLGDERGAQLVRVAATELATARLNAGLSQEAVASAAGLSRPQYGRIERGRSPHVSIRAVARLGAVLGLEASLKFYPVGDPVRDAAHLALLGRLQGRCHPSLSWRTEVPLPISGDRRAWDAMIGRLASPSGGLKSSGVEAETHPRDVQALDRKLALKERDGGVDRVLLVIADTRHNREFVRAHAATLRVRFPVDQRVALRAIADGRDPGGNALILL
jgi:transcriptional regulator with XRE-family HTH domain